MSRARSIGTFVAIVVTTLLLLLLIILPALASLLAQQTGSIPAWLTDLLNFSEDFTRWFMLAFVLVWVSFLGGTFASFLNVVAWRVPRGRSILGSSHCPNCDIKLSFKDNIPYIGWLKNGGKCSNCQSPISVRYLIVELVLGAIFLLIAAMVITTGGATLPFRESDNPSHWYSLIFDPRIELIQIIVFHWTLMLVLYTFALIELEWLRIPYSVWCVGAVFGLLFITIWPSVTLVAWEFPFVKLELNRFINVTVFAICGLLVGAVCGWVLDRCNFIARQPNSYIFGTTMTGLFLGWQSALVVAGITSIVSLISTRLKPGNETVKNLLHSPHSNLLMGTVIHLATWRWLQFV